MQKMIDYMSDVVGPKLAKLTQNVWIQAVQESFQIIMPFILLGSIMSLFKTLRGLSFLSWLPYSSVVSDYSFGLMGIMVAFLIPYLVLKKKKFEGQALVGGFTAFAAYLILMIPGGSYSASGLFVSLVDGFLTAIIMVVFLQHKMVKEGGVIPDFICNWFNTLIPVTIVVVIATIVQALGINLFDTLATVLGPLLALGQSYIGFLLCYFVMIFLFAFGVSAWAVAAVAVPIWNLGIQANIDAVAAGAAATCVNTTEVIFSGWLNIGGLGCTLPLVILALISQSRRLKAIGRAVLVPAIFNINEPTIYGLPIVWNPLLMIPFMLNAIIDPTIVYFTLKSGLVNIPAQAYQMSFLPTGINAFFVSNDWRGVILWAVVFAVSFLVYYPFWKAYEKQEMAKEAAGEE